MVVVVVVVVEEAVARARATSRVSAFSTWIAVGGRRGQALGERGGRLDRWCRWPCGGACGVVARRAGRRDLVSVAMRARGALRVVGRGGDEGCGRWARRSG